MLFSNIAYLMQKGSDFKWVNKSRARPGPVTADACKSKGARLGGGLAYMLHVLRCDDDISSPDIQLVQDSIQLILLFVMAFNIQLMATASVRGHEGTSAAQDYLSENPNESMTNIPGVGASLHDIVTRLPEIMEEKAKHALGSTHLHADNYAKKTGKSYKVKLSMDEEFGPFAAGTYISSLLAIMLVRSSHICACAIYSQLRLDTYT